MKNKEIKDLLGRSLKVGDKVIVGKDWARDCDWLVYGIVRDIKYCPVKTIATIEYLNIGRWNYGEDTKVRITQNSRIWEKYFTYEIPRSHNNLFIVEFANNVNGTNL